MPFGQLPRKNFASPLTKRSPLSKLAAMNPSRIPFFILFFSMIFLVLPSQSQAARFDKCECVDEDYTPPKGAVKMWTWPIKREWVERYHCMPNGQKIAYKVKVITYRERYTDGTQRTWKCVVAHDEIYPGK